MYKQYVLDLARELINIDSPTGYAHHAISFLKEKAESYGYTCTLSKKGNLLVFVEGKDHSKKMGVCAHTDTLGLMVRSIKGDGKLAITNLGGPLMATLDGEYCRIHTRDNKVYAGTILSTSPSVHVYKDSSTAPRNCDTMEIRIDEVVKNKEDVEKLGISNGDIIAIDPKCVITESGFIKSRFLDDKISVALLFGLLYKFSKENIQPEFDTYFIITSYEEVGHGNAWIPSEIESLLAVDMGCIGTDLSCTEYDVSICAKDSSSPYDYHLTSSLIDLAKSNQLQYAVDIYPFYSSDVSAAMHAGNNIKGALIGPGVHASHGMERTHIDGVMNTFKLVELYLTHMK